MFAMGCSFSGKQPVHEPLVTGSHRALIGRRYDRDRHGRGKIKALPWILKPVRAADCGGGGATAAGGK
jgi:hypothetical protein